MKSFKVGDYIGLRLMQEQLVKSLERLKENDLIKFDGTIASFKQVNESKHPNDAPARTKVTANVDETKKIFTEMAKSKDQKYVVNTGICDVMKQMWATKQKRNDWKHE